MHHGRRPSSLATGLVALILAVVSCGAAIAAPRTVPVTAGPLFRPRNVDRLAGALGFFPSAVTIHAGDAVRWQVNGFHTITFPGPRRPYPFLVTTAAKQPLTTAAAGTPFWWGGTAPQAILSPLAVLQQGTGIVTSTRQTHSSGLQRVLQASQNRRPAPYTLTFTKPGVYRYICAVHTVMHGVVMVLPRTAAVPSLGSSVRCG